MSPRKTTRVPPYDESAERALLGAMLHSPASAVAAAAAAGVTPDSFYRPSHGHVADAILAMCAAGVDVDPVTVAGELAAAGLGDQASVGDLTALVIDAPSTGHAAGYAQIVARHARARQLIAAAGELAELGYNGADPASVDHVLASLERAYTSAHRLEVVTMADVTAEPVEWLWPGRLARRKITLLDGDPDLGKSTLTLDLAARLSTGSPMPDGHPVDGPGSVLLISAEDGLADTVAPRLAAAGADQSRVHAVRLDADALTLPDQIDDLAATVARFGAVLVILDPLMAFLSADVNSYRDQDVRRVMGALARMAERTGAAVVIVRHLTKTVGGPAIYRGGGSIGLIGAARIGLVVGADPGDQTRRALAVTKCNLAAHAGTLGYRLAPDELHDCARIEWQGRLTISAQELVAAPLEGAAGDQSRAVDAAVSFLHEVLDEAPLWAKEVRDQAKMASISWRSVERAKPRAQVIAYKVGRPGDAEQGWKWRLPGTPEDRQKSRRPPPPKDGDLRENLAVFDGDEGRP